MVSTVIVLLVSRPDYLHQVFAALEFMDCPNDTALLVIEDITNTTTGVDEFVNHSKFAEKRIVTYKDTKKIKPTDWWTRRYRIATMHNLAIAHLPAKAFVMGVEDDTIVPPNALRSLHADYAIHPHAGFIEGVQLGRHATPYIGAWKADDVYNPTEISSVLPDSDTITEIDAGGLYCFLTRTENYTMHTFDVYDGEVGQNVMGPDVNFGIWLRRQGMSNYIDWRVNTNHLTTTDKGLRVLSLKNTQPARSVYTRKGVNWRNRFYYL